MHYTSLTFPYEGSASLAYICSIHFCSSTSFYQTSHLLLSTAVPWLNIILFKNPSCIASRCELVFSSCFKVIWHWAIWSILIHLYLPLWSSCCSQMHAIIALNCQFIIKFLQLYLFKKKKNNGWLPMFFVTLTWYRFHSSYAMYVRKYYSYWGCCYWTTTIGIGMNCALFMGRTIFKGCPTSQVSKCRCQSITKTYIHLWQFLSFCPDKAHPSKHFFFPLYFSCYSTFRKKPTNGEHQGWKTACSLKPLRKWICFNLMLHILNLGGEELTTGLE